MAQHQRRRSRRLLTQASLEINAIHVMDVDNPSRNYPIGIMGTAALTAAIFVLGTLAIAFIIPKADINLTQSLLVTYDDMLH